MRGFLKWLLWGSFAASIVVLVAAAIALAGGGDLLVAWWQLLVAIGGEAPAIIAILVGAVLYVLPAIIARSQRHHNEAAILALNLLLGWTLLGWAGALIWALTRPAPTAPPPSDRH